MLDEHQCHRYHLTQRARHNGLWTQSAMSGDRPDPDITRPIPAEAWDTPSSGVGPYADFPKAGHLDPPKSLTKKTSLAKLRCGTWLMYLDSFDGCQ